MPLPIIPPGQKGIAVGITFHTIVEMVQNFCDKTFKNLAGSPKKVTIDKDSHAVYYSKTEIDTLFAQNAGADGLRIYLAVHGNTQDQNTAMPHRPPSYIGQHTVILVCTKAGADMLSTSNSIGNLTGGNGLEEGEICPPPPCGKGLVDAKLHP